MNEPRRPPSHLWEPEHWTMRAEDRWKIGERVRLGWRPEHALVLR